MVAILKEGGPGCRSLRCAASTISAATWYDWKSKYTRRQRVDRTCLRELEGENARIKRM